jgi:hypothetical protein
VGVHQVEEATWLSPMVVVPKKNGKLKMVNFRKLSKTTKKTPYPLPFSIELLNTITWYETYSLLNGYSRYHQVSIAPKDRYKTTFIID